MTLTNQQVAPLKVTQCYVSITSQFKKPTSNNSNVTKKQNQELKFATENRLIEKQDTVLV